MTLKSILTTALALALLLGFSSTWAGSPLSIDDPGILDPGELEIITAVTMTSGDGGDFHELPLLDISLGVVKDYLQVGVGLSHVYVSPSGERSESDFGTPGVGLKYRFINNDRLQVAFAPGYVFGVAGSAADKGIGHTVNVAVFPINAEYQLNDAWRLNGELGYARSDGGDREWGYGVAIAYVADERRELLFEVSGSAGDFLGADFMQARVGIDHALSDSFHLLFSIGTGLREPDLEDSVNLDVFLGFKFLR